MRKQVLFQRLAGWSAYITTVVCSFVFLVGAEPAHAAIGVFPSGRLPTTQPTGACCCCFSITNWRQRDDDFGFQLPDDTKTTVS